MGNSTAVEKMGRLYDLLAPEGEGDGIAKDHANDEVLKLRKDAGVSTVLRHSLQQTFAGIAQWLSDDEVLIYEQFSKLLLDTSPKGQKNLTLKAVSILKDLEQFSAPVSQLDLMK